MGFAREAKRLCGGNIYRAGSMERAVALVYLCRSWRDGVKAAYPAVVSRGFGSAVEAFHNLMLCAFDGTHHIVHGDDPRRLRYACEEALRAAKYPEVLQVASRFLQKRIP